MYKTIDEISKAFTTHPDRVIKEIYAEYRESFLHFSHGISADEELIVDSFQEAVIALYENLVIGRINQKDTTVKTYLFAIGKHKLLNAVKRNSKEIKILQELKSENVYQLTPEESSDQKDILAKAFRQMGRKCRDIIMKYYYHKYSIDAIATEMNYKNNNTVKAHKSRCMAKLKDIVHNISKAS